MLVLAIESSCDETAVAILRGKAGQAAELLSSEIASQIPLHRAYGGVIPELASRNHSLHLKPLIEQALDVAGVSLQEIDLFAATAGPGLSSSLLIGASAAKALAVSAKKPFLAVNHMEGHLLSPFLTLGTIPPHIALIVSGGHTLLIKVNGLCDYEKLGTTLDDAAGEAFDKVAKMLGLPYPGGPEIEKLARTGNHYAYNFPRSMLKDPSFNFSFSGLKTSVLYTLANIAPDAGMPTAAQLPDLCASFQQAVIDVLAKKTIKAAAKYEMDAIALSGGVSLNGALRARFQEDWTGKTLYLANPLHCTDNAAMIAFTALQHYQSTGKASSLSTGIDPNLSLF